MKFYLKNADIILQTDGSSRDFADSIQVHGVGGVILLPKTREGRGIWGGCFRQFCGHLGNIDNAEYEGVAIGLEVVVKMVERGVVGDGSKFTFYIRTDNAKIYLYLKDKANRKDRNCDDVAKDIKKRVDYLVDRLEALGGEIHCERIDRAFNRFAKKLANDGAQMEVRDKSGKKAIPGNLTSWNELEVPVRAGLGRLFQEDFPTGLDLEVKFPM